MLYFNTIYGYVLQKKTLTDDDRIVLERERISNV